MPVLRPARRATPRVRRGRGEGPEKPGSGRDDTGDDGGFEPVRLDRLALEQAQEDDAVFVARLLLVRFDPPIFEKLLTLKDADGDRSCSDNRKLKASLFSFNGRARRLGPRRVRAVSSAIFADEALEGVRADGCPPQGGPGLPE